MRTESLYVANDDTVFRSCGACLRYENELKKQLEREHTKRVKEASDQFLRSVGFKPGTYGFSAEENHALNRTWIVFDKYGKIEGLKTCCSVNYPKNGCDFCYVSGKDKRDRTIFENWLKEHRLYAHRLSSFSKRGYLVFYEWDMLQKLENLGWKIKNGMIAY